MAGRFCIYTADSGQRVRARILTTHRDGWLTVEPWFFQEAGRDAGPMIGGKLQLHPADIDVQPEDMRAYHAAALVEV